MSFRLEMLQVARLSPKQLGDSATLVEQFLYSQLNEDGGFRDRSGKSDLYYSVFGLEGLIALRAELPAASVSSYLRGFGAGKELDLLHLCCLIRCWADICRSAPPLDAEVLTARIEAHRTLDGGYNTDPMPPAERPMALSWPWAPTRICGARCHRPKA